MRSARFISVALVLIGCCCITAQDKPAGQAFKIGEGKLEFTAPASWTKTQPANRLVEVEFSVTSAKGDSNPGRMTGMGAGGSVEQNVVRWTDSFVGEGGTAVKPKRDKLTVGGVEIEIIDLTGTYKDMPGGPFAGGKTINRDNYRMLGAIIQTKDAGNYFVKLYGPKTTIDENEKGFQDMVKSLRVK